MSFPDITRVVNDVQRSNLKHKCIVESAVIDYYKVLGKAEAIKEATGKTEIKLKEADEANKKDTSLPIEGQKPLSRMSKNELFAKCAALNVADKIFDGITNPQLMALVKEATEKK